MPTSCQGTLLRMATWDGVLVEPPGKCEFRLCLPECSTGLATFIGQRADAQQPAGQCPARVCVWVRACGGLPVFSVSSFCFSSFLRNTHFQAQGWWARGFPALVQKLGCRHCLRPSPDSWVSQEQPEGWRGLSGWPSSTQHPSSELVSSPGQPAPGVPAGNLHSKALQSRLVMDRGIGGRALSR